jgi:hypothetical protein
MRTCNAVTLELCCRLRLYYLLERPPCSNFSVRVPAFATTLCAPDGGRQVQHEGFQGVVLPVLRIESPCPLDGRPGVHVARDVEAVGVSVVTGPEAAPDHACTSVKVIHFRDL